ncbi:DEAD/DEAH box helicase domain-containing protein [Besnoitia besnoiti]|uniref:DEAD/DEAH box helicase domain-containing protein n=1 Tax=Besnoitia besnoiti TaxID=94643 RepID=A0A2A9MG42_BESBE|nr:DEAD/DEAH box helicase domain-containing protein [Besnoitia besnoiti]PFH34567.1 DEAD/DEAH box helicase domain-containing protein [Besnoitia besnoiti]
MENFFLAKGEEVEPAPNRPKLPLPGDFAPSNDRPAAAPEAADEEDDPLDAYMSKISEQIQVEDEAIRQRQEREAEERAAALGEAQPETACRGSDGDAAKTRERFFDDEDSLADSYAYVLDQRQKEAEAQAAALSKARRKKTRGGDSDDELHREEEDVRGAKQLASVDHSMYEYPAFQRDIYVEAADISSLSHDAAGELRRSLQISITGLNAPRPIASFLHLKECLSKALFTGINKRGFVLPTPIQSAAIPCLMKGRDLLGLAETGSGKTAAYLIPLLARLQHLKEEERWPKQHVHYADRRPEKVGGLLLAGGPAGLVLCPTRELAVQIDGEVHALIAKSKQGSAALSLKHVLLAGGFDKTEQYKALKVGVDVAVCNPGRLIDLATMKGMEDVLKKAVIVVVDEADKMVQMGFENQLRTILSAVRPDRITCMFSATLPHRCEAISKHFLRSPIKITIGEGGQAAKSVEQNVMVVPDEQKKYNWLASHLLSLLAASSASNSSSLSAPLPAAACDSDRGKVAVVFCNTQQRCEDLAFLLEDEISAQMNDIARGSRAPASAEGSSDGWDKARKPRAMKELTDNETTKAAAARLLQIDFGAAEPGKRDDPNKVLRRNAEQTFKYVTVVHGGLNQTERLSAIRRLHQHILKPPPPPVSSLPPTAPRDHLISPLVLVATDVAARGLDFPAGLSLVVSYDAPPEGEVYVHRIGRAGRAGRRGRAFALLTRTEKRAAALLVEAMEGVNQEAPRHLLDIAMGYAPFRTARLAGMKMEEPKGKGKKKRDHRHNANAAFGLGYTGSASSDGSAASSAAPSVYAKAASAAAAAILRQKEQNLQEASAAAHPGSSQGGGEAASSSGAAAQPSAGKRGRWDSSVKAQSADGLFTLQQLQPASAPTSAFSLASSTADEAGGRSGAGAGASAHVAGKQVRVVGIDDELSSDEEAPALPPAQASAARPGLLNLSKREERRRQWAEENEARRVQREKEEMLKKRGQSPPPPRKAFSERRAAPTGDKNGEPSRREDEGTGSRVPGGGGAESPAAPPAYISSSFWSTNSLQGSAATSLPSGHAAAGDAPPSWMAQALGSVAPFNASTYAPQNSGSHAAPHQGAQSLMQHMPYWDRNGAAGAPASGATAAGWHGVQTPGAFGAPSPPGAYTAPSHASFAPPRTTTEAPGMQRRQQLWQLRLPMRGRLRRAETSEWGGALATRGGRWASRADRRRFTVQRERRFRFFSCRLLWAAAVEGCPLWPVLFAFEGAVSAAPPVCAAFQRGADELSKTYPCFRRLYAFDFVTIRAWTSGSQLVSHRRGVFVLLFCPRGCLSVTSAHNQLSSVRAAIHVGAL